jgi:acetyl-CoA carboxylase biotin carboxyl carrier protein
MPETLSLQDIGSLLELLDKHEVNEFKLEREGESIWLRRGESAAVQPQSTAPIHQVFTSMGHPQSVGHAPQQVDYLGHGPVAAAAPAAVEVVPPKKSTLKDITSPMVGTFYRRPSVDSDAYVNVGDKVKKGDVLCIVEAMKLMNEIETELAGTIVEICLEDGQMVEYGEVLFRVEPL